MAHSAPGAPGDEGDSFIREVLAWYAISARVLPWRDPAAGPWAVLVSEIMLQQTQVDRVLPVYAQWLERWPTPAALAAASPGDAVRAWGRLGYPRRAVRLHAAAATIVAEHNGVVPAELEVLRALPGIGEYTAAAVAAFAYRQRHAVLDTNVRRVIARAVGGIAAPPLALTAAERQRATSLLPDDAERAATFGVALMELGALVCQARSPRCDACPVAARCAWRAAGYPPSTLPARRSQRYAGTDRQARGVVLAALRASTTPTARATLAAQWKDDQQLDRAIAGLVEDGLIEPLAGSCFQLPT
jgi:A/G-specific adenine glycosylase